MNLLRWKRKDAELEAEIGSHIEQAIRDRVDRGESPEEARINVLREFGNVALVKETTRNTWKWSWLESFAQNLKFGLRGLRRNPGFAAISILTLALGIGATTAIFSVVYGVILRPLPFGDPERLVTIWTNTPQVARLPLTASDHQEIRSQITTLEDIAILRASANYNLTGNVEPQWLQGSSIPANLLPLLKVQPILGRNFTAEENHPGQDQKVILSHALWQRLYGGDVNIIGREIRLEQIPYTVVGVMSPKFQFPTRETQIWTPLTINPADFQTRTGYGHMAVGRLKPGVSIEQVQKELDLIASRLAQQYPAVKGGVRFEVTPLREDVASTASKPLITLLAASLGLLLIGCCNLTNLLLTRTLSRARETAVRSALGATQNKLLLQTIGELLPLLVIGAVLGLFVAQQSINSLLPLLPTALPRVDEISVNIPVLLFSIGLLVVAATLVLIVPLRQMRRADLVSTLSHDSRTSTGGAKTKIRSLLVVGQVALTVMLLTGAGLLIRTFAALKNVNPGFNSNGVLSLRLAIPRNKYNGDPKVAALCNDILEKVRPLPGVIAAGMGNRLPLSGPSGLSTIEFERKDRELGSLSATDDTSITPGYLDAMNIPLLRGRSFTESDGANSPLVVIIDEQVALRAWPGEDPIGKRVRSGPSSPWAEVIGIVGHVRHEKLESDQRFQIYWNYWQRARDRMSLVVRTSGEPHLLVPPVLAAIKSVDPDQPAFAIRTMDEVIDQSLSIRWLNTMVVSLFAGSSLLLAVIGIYGVLAWNVKQRTREIGVRLALGAQQRTVVLMVVANSLKLTAFGIAIGVAGSLVLARFLRSLLFSVGQTDPVTFVVVPALLIVGATLAALIPALKAIRVNPIVALRHD
jgi:putative ABC transport system permease protein